MSKIKNILFQFLDLSTPLFFSRCFIGPQLFHHFCSYSRIKIFSYTNFTTFAGIAGAVEEVSLAAVAGDGVDDPGRGDRVYEGRLSATYFTKHEN